MRSDLAKEAIHDLGHLPEGATLHTHRVGRIEIHRMRVQTEEAATSLGKGIGHYVSLERPKLHVLEGEEREIFSRLLAGELKAMAERMTKPKAKNPLSVLVVGLGNADLSADSLGPRTVARLTPTGHMTEEAPTLLQELGCASLFLFSPGVTGQTGIEGAVLLQAIAQAVRPDLIVAVDSLVARSCESLSNSVQLSDTGLVPGSGVGNRRQALSKETIGVPVMSLGVPTAVETDTLIRDAADSLKDAEKEDFLRKVPRKSRSFLVSPADCDRVVHRLSALLARAITLAFLGDSFLDVCIE